MILASRDINELEINTRNLCNRLIERCADEGIKIIVTSTYRSWDKQDCLYAQGRTTSGKIITNAKGGYSWHNFRRAFDVVPLDSRGICVWEDSSLWQKIGAIGKSLGLEWGGDFKTFKDRPHFQYTQGMSLAQAREMLGKDAALA